MGHPRHSISGLNEAAIETSTVDRLEFEKKDGKNQKRKSEKKNVSSQNSKLQN